MNDDGYTLIEMLVALAIIGLAFGGLTQGARVIAKLETGAAHASAEANTRRLAGRTLDSVLTNQGPFLSSGLGAFSGEPSGFTFACGNGAPCGAKLETVGARTRLVSVGPGATTPGVDVPPGAEFRYGDDQTMAQAWPGSATPIRALHSISLVVASGQEGPIATFRVPVDEPAHCVFDSVAQGCRS